jgi:cytochrome c oxidase cbb3-type subunit IV
MIEHETALWLSKSVGLFYLIFMSVLVVIYCYRPANKAAFDRAARAILDEDDQP